MNSNSGIVLHVVFYQETPGKMPVKEWLRTLDKKSRFIIGTHIKKVQFGWPLGMPLVKPIGKGLWEIRSSLDNKIVRIIFTLHQGKMVLLHGFIKKSKKIPKPDLELARKRTKNIQEI